LTPGWSLIRPGRFDLIGSRSSYDGSVAKQSGEALLPKWLIPALKWGGIALVVLSVIALIVADPATAPMALYWVLLIIGAVAVLAGFLLRRRRSSAPD
jgi:hypothetical protein